MKIVSQKQRFAAMECLAELLKKDGWAQTKTVEQWLDEAEMHPAQFQNSYPALQVMNLLGFGAEVVEVGQLA